MSKFNAGQSFADGDTVTGAKLNNITGLLNIYSGLISEQTAMAVTVSTADQLLIADTDQGDAGIANRITVKKLFNDALTNGTYTNSHLSGNLNVTQLSTLGTIDSTRGTIGILNSTTGTITGLRSTNGTISNLSTTLAGDFTISQGTGTLGTTGVTLGTYGGSTSIPTVVVDAKGRITSSTANSITYTASATGAVSRSLTGKLQERISVKDFGAVGDGTTDDTAALQAAFDYATSGDGVSGNGYSVHIPAGRYMISSTLYLPNAINVHGDGRQMSIIRPLSGFTGVMITDKGNAGKIFLSHLRIEAMGIAGVTGIIKLGYGTQPFGSAEMYSLFLSGGLPGVSILNGCTALDLVTNVVTITEVEAGFCDTIFKLGPNSTVTTFSRCLPITMKDYAFQLNGSASLIDCEIEAPQSTAIGVYASRQTVITNLTYSQALSTANTYAIEIDAACPKFSMNGFTNLQKAGATLDAVIKDNRSGFSENWIPKSSTLKSVGLASDELFLGTDSFSINKKAIQFFTLRITNTAGTIQHRISVSGSAGNLYSKINDASITLQNTPTGADASTAFAYGGKIGSATTSAFIFDTGVQVIASQIGIATITYNSTTTALNVIAFVASQNINGVTQARLNFQFTNATTGANYAIAGMGVGAILDVTFMGFLV